MPQQLFILWPALLAKETRLALAHKLDCRGPSVNIKPNRLLLAAEETLVLQKAAIFVNQHQPPPHVPSNHWAEVTHCGFDGTRYDNVNGKTPMWFAIVPGSGVSVNVGNTLHITRSSHKNASAIHKALVTANYERLYKALFPDSPADQIAQLSSHRCRLELSEGCHPRLMQYDSIQFPLWKKHGYSELVMLSWGREQSFLTSYIDHVRCGKAPHLRVCSGPSDPVLRQQGPSCLRSVRRLPVMMQLWKSNGCKLPEKPKEVLREAPWDPNLHVWSDDYEIKSDTEVHKLMAHWSIPESRMKYLESSVETDDAESLVTNGIRQRADNSSVSKKRRRKDFSST